MEILNTLAQVLGVNVSQLSSNPFPPDPDRSSSPLALVQLDQIKLVLLLLLSVPLSLVFPLLPASSILAHLFASLPAFVYLALVLDLPGGFAQLLLSALITWGVVKVGVKGNWGRRMPWTVFAIVMGHLAIK